MCDSYCANHGCNGSANCPARAAKVAPIKASRPADHGEYLPPDEGHTLRWLARAWLAFVLVAICAGLAFALTAIKFA